MSPTGSPPTSQILARLYARTLYLASNLDSFTIAAEGDTVFWITHSAGAFSHDVWRGTVTDMPEAPMTIGSVPVPADGTLSGGMKARADKVYWALDNKLYSAAMDGSGTTTVVDDTNGVRAWDIRGDLVVYSDSLTGGLHALESGTPRVVAADALAGGGVHLSGETIYFSTPNDELKSIGLDGTGAAMVTSGNVSSTTRIIVSSSAFVWANTAAQTNGGGVYRLCR